MFSLCSVEVGMMTISPPLLLRVTVTFSVDASSLTLDLSARVMFGRTPFPLGEMQRHVYIRIPVRVLINLTGKGVKSMEIERRHPESVRSRAEISKLQHQRKAEERRK